MFENANTQGQNGGQQPQQAPKMNIDVKPVAPMPQSSAPQQPVQQTQSSSQRVYTMPEAFLPNMTEGKSGASGKKSGGGIMSGNKKWFVIAPAVIVVVLLIVVLVVLSVQRSANQVAVPQEVSPEAAAVNNAVNTAQANAANVNASDTPLNRVVNEDLEAEIEESLLNTNTNTNTNATSSTVEAVEPVERTVANTKDSDNDDLTDEEEENVYNTTPTLPDTDKDGYIDGTEIINLFSPLKDGQTLIKSGLVIEEESEDFGWTIYYPAEWLVESLDDDGREVLFTPDTVDDQFVEVVVADNDDELTAAEWYADQFDDVDEKDLETVSVGELDGIVSDDGFAYYVATDDYIIGIIYSIGTNTSVHFRTTFEMMVASFSYTPPKKKSASSQNTADETDAAGVEDTNSDTTNTNGDTNTNAANADEA